jgi:hypothetical protein
MRFGMRLTRAAMLTFLVDHEWCPGAHLPEGWMWSQGEIVNGGIFPITQLDWCIEREKNTVKKG